MFCFSGHFLSFCSFGCIDVAICDPVYDVETVSRLCYKLRTASENPV